MTALSATQPKAVICSLFLSGDSSLADRYPEGILIWSETKEYVQAFLTREKITGLCEPVDVGFYTQSDCHVVLKDDTAQYRTGFHPVWKENE